jgi:hypothetical protein
MLAILEQQKQQSKNLIQETRNVNLIQNQIYSTRDALFWQMIQLLPGFQFTVVQVRRRNVLGKWEGGKKNNGKNISFLLHNVVDLAIFLEIQSFLILLFSLVINGLHRIWRRVLLFFKDATTTPSIWNDLPGGMLTCFANYDTYLEILDFKANVK